MNQRMSQGLTHAQIDALRQEIKPTERILQIIHLNLLLGASVLVGILFFKSQKIAGNDAPVPLLFFVVGVASVVPSILVPAWMRMTKLSNNELRDESVGKLANLYQVSHIVGCAILEAGVVFSALAFLLADVVPQWFILVPAILLLQLLLRFPLPGRLADWVATKLESSQG